MVADILEAHAGGVWISHAALGVRGSVMRLLSAFLCVALGIFGRAGEPGLGELHYRATLVFRGEKAPVTTRFVVVPLPVAETRNKVKKPRMSGWRVEGVQRKEDSFSQAAVLARVERLLYFSGPEPSLVQKPVFVRYDEKRCQVWQAPAPAGLHVYAYLVEAAPGILALSYLSGTFEHGDLASVELQLEHFRLPAGTVPAENGTVLLSTLRRLAADAGAGLEAPDETVE